MSTTQVTTQMIIDAAWEVAIEEYQGGKTAAELGRALGLDARRLREVLIAKGVFVEGRRRARSPMCPAGIHDMATHGRQAWKTRPDGSRVKNGRYCDGCRKVRAQR